MSGTLRRWFDAYLVGWILGCVGAAISHLLLNHDEAAGSQWSHSPGWQREIGLFNLAVGFVLVQVLRRGDDDSKRMMARTALCLAPLLGGNHVAALAGSGAGGDRIHWTALGLNVLSGSVSGSLLVADRYARRRSDSPAAAARSEPRDE